MFKTTICELLGIEYPILQGGMAWVATAELAASVSNAGGLGIIGAGNAPAEVVQAEIRKVKKETDQPFGVNVYFMSPYVDEVLEVILREEVPVITMGAGNPGKYIKRLKENGTIVIPVVASVALARRLERVGVDALIAEGMECGGHIGEIATMALVPQIVDAVGIPVIAAGGIYDGRGLAAALALGAAGVQLGTRFVCARECTAHDNYKQAIIKARDRSTVVTGTSLGHPVRVLKNRFAREMLAMEKQGADPHEIEEFGTGKLRDAVVEGDIDGGSVMAGQIGAMVSRVESTEDIIKDLISGARKQLRLLKQYASDS